jgi:phosphodiesterase/alkaline phosphatase D-like protein
MAKRGDQEADRSVSDQQEGSAAAVAAAPSTEPAGIAESGQAAAVATAADGAASAGPLAGDAFPDGELADAAEIGAVTDRSVRVWGRVPGGPELRGRLEVEGLPAVEAAVPVTAETDWTGAIVLELPEPAPDRPFACLVGERRLTARLAPAPETRAGFAFGFGSCHRPFAVGKDDRVEKLPIAAVYPQMAEHLAEAEARFLLLGGDQIYSDEIDPISVRYNLPGDEQHPPTLDQALAAYRQVSRGYLGETGFRALRQRFPTLCMWDDHDIFNDWGSRLDKSPRDRRLFEAAARAYGEYQHARNPGGTIGPPPYPWHLRWGTAAFLAVDVRSARDYPAGTLLGGAQWDWLKGCLRGQSDELRGVETLFVVFSIPMGHVARWMVRLVDRLPGEAADEARDRWSSVAFVDNRDAVLRELFAWQSAAPARQAILLSGDVHAASAFSIRRRSGPGVVQQFTSSAFTSPSTWGENALGWLAVRGTNWREPDLRFRRHFLVLRNNYGLVRLEPLPAGGHRVTFEVRAWHPRRRRLLPAGRVVVEPSPA